MKTKQSIHLSGCLLALKFWWRFALVFLPPLSAFIIFVSTEQDSNCLSNGDNNGSRNDAHCLLVCGKTANTLLDISFIKYGTGKVPRDELFLCTENDANLQEIHCGEGSTFVEHCPDRLPMCFQNNYTLTNGQSFGTFWLKSLSTFQNCWVSTALEEHHSYRKSTPDNESTSVQLTHFISASTALPWWTNKDKKTMDNYFPEAQHQIWLLKGPWFWQFPWRSAGLTPRCESKPKSIRQFPPTSGAGQALYSSTEWGLWKHKAQRRGRNDPFRSQETKTNTDCLVLRLPVLRCKVLVFEHMGRSHNEFFGNISLSGDTKIFLLCLQIAVCVWRRGPCHLKNTKFEAQTGETPFGTSANEVSTENNGRTCTRAVEPRHDTRGLPATSNPFHWFQPQNGISIT